IGDIHITDAIHGDPGRIMESRGAAATVGAADYAGGTGNGGDYSSRRNLADGMVILICHVEITGAVHGNSKRTVESCGAACSIGTASYPRSAGQRRHHAGRRDFAHRVVRAISDVDIPRAIDGNAIQVTETSVTACIV